MCKAAPHAAYHFLLTAQIRMIEDRRADVTELLEVGGRRDDALVDDIANDLVGAPLDPCRLGRGSPWRSFRSHAEGA